MDAKVMIQGDKEGKFEDEEVGNHLGSCKNGRSHSRNTTSLITKLTSKITDQTKILNATDPIRTKPQVIQRLLVAHSHG